MAKVLIIYSTVDGHTRHICQKLQQVNELAGHQVSLVSIEDADEGQLLEFDKLVIGASIRYGKHRKSVYKFIDRNLEAIQSRSNAFFSVNLVARKPEKNRPETNPYLKKFLKQTAWRPGELAVFAGRIDYPIYSLGDRLVIRFIMWMTHGPTDPGAVVEYTDWGEVEAFGRRISRM